MHTDEPLLRSYPSHVGVSAVGAEKKKGYIWEFAGGR